MPLLLSALSDLPNDAVLKIIPAPIKTDFTIYTIIYMCTLILV